MSEGNRGFMAANNQGISVTKEQYLEMNKEQQDEFANNCNLENKSILVYWELEEYERLHGSLDFDAREAKETREKFFENDLKDYLTPKDKY